MSDFRKAFDVLMKLEFSNASNILHKNKSEMDYTVAGIYKYAHPNWLGWFIVSNALQNNDGNITAASRELYRNTHLKELIMQFYMEQFWLRLRLDELHSDNTATEIFLLGVNIGCRNAVRKAQKVVGAHQDGLIGPVTIGLLNNYNEKEFSVEFDEVEKQYYSDLIKRRPSLSIYANGWKNRAEYV
jgi:lysozyme family protein